MYERSIGTAFGTVSSRYNLYKRLIINIIYKVRLPLLGTIKLHKYMIFIYLLDYLRLYPPFYPPLYFL